MRHSLVLEGPAFRLRPVEAADAAFIVRLRTSDRARGTLHPVSGSVADQAAWLESYFERAGDWYWIVERRVDAEPQGTAGLYGLDPVARRAEWGRWILAAGSLGAPESALLVYRAAFERLDLAEVYCRTVATNASVLSFHERSGLERAGVMTGAFELDGERVDAVEHRLTRDRWPAVEAGLAASAERVATLLARP